MLSFEIHKNGFAGPLLTDLISVPADGSTAQQIVLVHSDGAGGAGADVNIKSSVIFFIDKIKGKLDNNGRFHFRVGPSFGAKGDAMLTITINGIIQPRILTVRFF